MGIEYLNPRSAADVDRVATLYEENLADSPVVLLGPRFLREFFFKKLVESDLLGCLVCRVDGNVVAFLSWTNHPGDFIGRGIKKHFVGLVVDHAQGDRRQAVVGEDRSSRRSRS